MLSLMALLKVCEYLMRNRIPVYLEIGLWLQTEEKVNPEKLLQHHSSTQHFLKSDIPVQINENFKINLYISIIKKITWLLEITLNGR